MITSSYKKLLYFGLLFSASLPAQIWFQIGLGNTELSCPDQIHIQGNTYQIKNECYGKEAYDFLLEKGLIALSKDSVEFRERNITQRSFLQEKSKTMTFRFKTLSSGEVQLEQGQRVFSFIPVDL
ncbi:hypothetical protein TW85_17240 [Marinomonas sp. S3726]|uniref:hypothetical protein n=1 Tax=Marinomonas sp. S3726 TaxID=579484 RepID=UPI0005FA5114|nr:hypothetical protein [Marinomonas sp. S3726]KJZ11190.1 hypothetical protein TW85_17240 [Marinomonas sp. S3726]